MKKLALITSSLSLFALPVVASAQFVSGNPNSTGLQAFFDAVSSFINDTLVPLVFAIAFLVFIYGVVKFFILGGDDSENREDGKQLMIYSIIGFVLMIAIWGIVTILSNSLFGPDRDLQDKDIPNVPSSRSGN